MTQVVKKSDYEAEVKECQQKVAKEVNKRNSNSSLGGLNPRYYENARTPKKAKIYRDLKSLTYNKVLF
ncbi:MAG: hypothetical protein ACXABG_13710 [Promethearchaeota archaeon]|jgi:hypothetical protein